MFAPIKRIITKSLGRLTPTPWSNVVVLATEEDLLEQAAKTLLDREEDPTSARLNAIEQSLLASRARQRAKTEVMNSVGRRSWVFGVLGAIKFLLRFIFFSFFGFSYSVGGEDLSLWG